MPTKSYAAKSEKAALTPFEITRRDVMAEDIAISIDYCGVCHTDVHFVRNDWGRSVYPMVPGHEIIGRVTKVGEAVSDFKVGDCVGVGVMVGSCQHCSACDEGLEQYCENGVVATYNGPDHISGGVTYGGYAEDIVVNRQFVLHIPDGLDTQSAGPLLCAGITTYSPLKQWQIKKGEKVGIIGLGGLGHMGVKFAVAMGAHVVMITSSAAKGEDARKLGAHEVLISKDAEQMATYTNSFDFLLNTIPVAHDVNPYLALLKWDKTMVMVGALEPLPDIDGAGLIAKRKRIAGSLIGGISETQDMLEFCAKYQVLPEVEMINIQDIDQAYERMLRSDVKYRFVIDMKSLRHSN